MQARSAEFLADSVLDDDMRGVVRFLSLNRGRYLSYMATLLLLRMGIAYSIWFYIHHKLLLGGGIVWPLNVALAVYLVGECVALGESRSFMPYR